MKNNKIQLLKWSFYIAFSIWAFIYLIKVIQPELHFHMQQPPFLATLDFFKHYLTFPGGLTEYISTFLLQFFFYGWPGAIIILLVGISLVFLVFKITEPFKANGFELIWFFIPASLLFVLFNSYYFPLAAAIKVLLVYLATWLFGFSSKRGNLSYIIHSILYLAIYYIVGGSALLLFSLNVIILSFYYCGIKKGTIYSGITIAIYLLFPYFSFKYLFNVTLNDAYFSIMPDIVTMLQYKKTATFEVFFYFLPAILVLLTIYYSFSKNKSNGSNTEKQTEGMPEKSSQSWVSNMWVTTAMAIVVLFLLTFVLFKNTQKEHEKNIILANYYSYNEQWDKVVGVAVSDTVYDVFMNYFFNRAIDNAGHFLDLFFDYPQYMGIDGLHPDKLNNIAIAFLSSDIYYDLGYISEATHWASEAQSVLPYSPRVLRRLALVNIIDGNFEAARKYLTVLDENFLNKDFVLKYMPYVDDTTLILRDKILSEKRSQIPYFNPAASDISDRFLQLLEKNSMNKRAYDHLEMSYLLEHQLGLFMKYLPLGKKFYKAMPEVFEQAFVLIMIAKGDNNLTQFKISQSTKELAQGYIKILKQNKKNKKVAKALLAREYANTYLYYAMFNSPLVTHAKLTVSEATEYK